MQTQKRLGMQLLDEHLYDLVQSGTVDKNIALQYAQFPGDLRQRLAGD